MLFVLYVESEKKWNFEIFCLGNEDTEGEKEAKKLAQFSKIKEHCLWYCNFTDRNLHRLVCLSAQSSLHNWHFVIFCL